MHPTVVLSLTRKSKRTPMKAMPVLALLAGIPYPKSSGKKKDQAGSTFLQGPALAAHLTQNTTHYREKSSGRRLHCDPR
jgi:hypothetical protein